MHDIVGRFEVKRDGGASHVDYTLNRSIHPVDASSQITCKLQVIDANQSSRTFRHQGVLGFGLSGQRGILHLPQDQPQTRILNRHSDRISRIGIGTQEDVDVGRGRQDFRGRCRALCRGGLLEDKVTRHPHKSGDLERDVACKLHDIIGCFEVERDLSITHFDCALNRSIHAVDASRQGTSECEITDANQRGRAFCHQRVFGLSLGGQRGVVHFAQNQTEVGIGDRDANGIGRIGIRAEEDIDVGRGGQDFGCRRRALRRRGLFENKVTRDTNKAVNLQRDIARELCHIFICVKVDGVRLSRGQCYCLIDFGASTVDAGS